MLTDWWRILFFHRLEVKEKTKRKATFIPWRMATYPVSPHEICAKHTLIGQHVSQDLSLTIKVLLNCLQMVTTYKLITENVSLVS
jgi:hypothetical protein